MRPFGETLRYIRIARGLRIDEIAAMSGRNAGYLSTIERDKAQASAEFLLSVAGYYGCPWWNGDRNRLWLQNLAWWHGNLGVDILSAQGQQLVQVATERAGAMVAVCMQAEEETAGIRREINRVLGGLQLPGFHRLSLAQTQPVWAWVVASLEPDVLAGCSGSPKQQVECYLDAVMHSMKREFMDVDAQVLGTRVRRRREALGMTPEHLARVVTDIRGDGLESESFVDSNLITGIEEGRLPIGMDVLSALARALDVSPSVLLRSLGSDVLVAADDELLRALRRYGIPDDMIGPVHEILQRLRESSEQ